MLSPGICLSSFAFLFFHLKGYWNFKVPVDYLQFVMYLSVCPVFIFFHVHGRIQDSECSSNFSFWFSGYSVQFSRSVVSNSMWPHEPQHARPPCPSPTPGVHPNPCPSSWWCHPTISCSVIPFSSCPQSFPASGSFPMSQIFASGIGQSIGVSVSTSVLPMNTQDWSPLGWTGWISLQSKGLSLVRTIRKCR